MLWSIFLIFRMHTRIYALPVIIACVAVYICYPVCLSVSIFGVLTIFAVLISGIGVVWVHILLSSPHKTGVGIEHVHKDLDIFRNKLMVGVKLFYQQIHGFYFHICNICFRENLTMHSCKKAPKITYLLYLEELSIVYYNSC